MEGPPQAADFLTVNQYYLRIDNSQNIHDSPGAAMSRADASGSGSAVADASARPDPKSTTPLGLVDALIALAFLVVIGGAIGLVVRGHLGWAAGGFVLAATVAVFGVVRFLRAR